MTKPMLRWLGLMLALLAGIYFARYAQHALAGRNLSALLDHRVLVAGMALTMLYILLIPATAIAWTWLLRTMEQRPGYGRMLNILAVTQFGKYLPGNMAQHIGLRRAGTRQPAHGCLRCCFRWPMKWCSRWSPVSISVH